MAGCKIKLHLFSALIASFTFTSLDLLITLIAQANASERKKEIESEREREKKVENPIRLVRSRWAFNAYSLP